MLLITNKCQESDGRREYYPNATNVQAHGQGRLAFRALFSRGRSPQSFSPPQEETNVGVEYQRPNSERSNEEATQLDLNSKPWEPVSSDQGPHCQDIGNDKDGIMTIGLLQVKLTSNTTDFKPYKRCSVESRLMNSGNQEHGNCSKRLRLEKVASP